MRIRTATLILIGPGLVHLAWGQLRPPNTSGVSMGHLHYYVEDVESNRQFWMRLGGESVRRDEPAIIRFPDVLVFLDAGSPSGNTEGSVVNHVAFRVESLETIEGAGFRVERLEEFPGVASVRTPEGERIELFDETATNLAFTVDGGTPDPVAERHNRAITVPIIAHHIHLYLPQGAENEAKAWYADLFGAIPGMRWRYPAVDLPGINVNFSGNANPQAPTRGRMLDHIGFEVRNLEDFSEDLEARGIALDVPYSVDLSGIGRAFLTDPWGTRIELTEGLEGR